MANLCQVERLRADELSCETYDGVFASLGFESRAPAACAAIRPQSGRKVAVAFAERHLLSFTANKKAFERAGFSTPIIEEDKIVDWCRRFVNETADVKGTKLLVDVSSASRLRIAAIVVALLESQRENSVSVDFVYSIAKWSAPTLGQERIVASGPVLPRFAGWSARPDIPTSAVIGLGYEFKKAIGAYEYLEATDVWTFFPESRDKRYHRDVAAANEHLLRLVEKERQLRYSVDQMFHSYALLESVVGAAKRTSRPVLLPFGPKSFALVSALVASVHREVGLWRVSSGQFGEPHDREASGDIAGIRATFAGRMRETQEEIPEAVGHTTSDHPPTSAA